MSNPLHTSDQASAERLALRLIERSDIRAAREVARREMLSDPMAATLDGSLGLDRALDQWVLALAMREANGDPADPKVVWNVSNPPRQWFGHVYHGAAVAVDNPDNFNREIPIDGDRHYEIGLRFSADPPQFSIVIEMEPEHHAGLGRNIGALTLQQLLPYADDNGSVILTVGPEEGGPLHLRSEVGRIQIYTRDSQASWSQAPAEVTVRRLDPPVTWQSRSEDEIAATIIGDLPAWVHFWSHFKDDFLGNPEPNRLVGPSGRDGNWGYLAGGRYRISDGEALLVTLDPSGSNYTGFQITDPWTIAPDPMLRLASLNRSQCTPNADGTVTYSVSLADPGVANWIDTCGMHEGWMMTRWQGVPADTAIDRMIQEVRLVQLDDIPTDIPRIDLASRRAQIAKRAPDFAKRTAQDGWPMQPDGSILELCHVTADLDAAMIHWSRELRAGPFFAFDVPVLPGQLYYGVPTEVALRVAFGFSGEVLIELIEQTNEGASPFLDFIRERGPGLHHVMPRGDFDVDHARLSAAGHAVAYAGKMPGGERFCLFDTRSASGCYTELMEISAPMERMLSLMEAAHRDWDGVSDPIRRLDQLL